MSFLPRFNFTTAMVRNLGTIESAQAVIDFLPLPPDRVLRLRQAARRRATRNSTGIEGNTLNGVEIDQALQLVPRSAGGSDTITGGGGSAWKHCGGSVE
jgi:hypothetical protein